MDDGARPTARNVLVIGGYGFFGKRIAAGLAAESAVHVQLAGRDLAQARGAAADLGLPESSAIAIDATADTLPATLRSRNIHTVVHTAGPFQGQDYRVARAAIAAGCNYVDIADGRRFVAGIGALDPAAKAAGVAVVSGASSVPGLSSAVVARYLPAFEQLESIRIGISSGARAPGLATVQGVFGYCGKPFRRLERGTWVETHGWRDLQRHRFPQPVGTRLLGSCDVPDLELFPLHYPGVRTVTFHAGFASSAGHLVVWMLAGLVKAGILADMAPLAAPMNRLSRWLEPVISDKGGMFVEMEGLGRDGRALVKRWHLVACQNHGPYIPCGAAIALVRKLARGEAIPIGASPCVGLLTVEAYLASLQDLDISVAADPA